MMPAAAPTHFCACFDCQAALCRAAGFFVADHPRGEGHVGVRFGDVAKGLEVELDGERLDLVVEAFARRDGIGWAIVLTEPTHVCERCGESVCVTFRFGEVRIRRHLRVLEGGRA